MEEKATTKHGWRIIFFVLLMLSQCRENESPFGRHFELIPDYTNNEVKVGMVFSIAANSKYFAVPDKNRGLIHVFDHEGKLVNSYGNTEGQPTRFISPDILFMDETHIWIWDTGKNSVYQYSTEGRLLKRVGLNASVGYKKFCVHEGYLYFHSNTDFPVLQIDPVSGALVKGFGEFYPPYDQPAGKSFNNLNGYILPFRGGIMTVNAQHAEWCVYDPQGNLLEKKQLPELEACFQVAVGHYLSNLKGDPDVNTAVINIMDAAVDRNRLFLLIVPVPNNPQIDGGNTILVVNPASGKILNNITLPGKMYFSFAVKEGICLAYNHNDARFEFFKLPDKIYR